MDRPIVYTQELGRSADFLGASKATMYGLGFLAQAILGSAISIQGLALAQTPVASLSVLLSSGSIYTLATADATAYGSLGPDSNVIYKQGILAAPQTTLGPLTAPATAGFSQNYLVQAAYQDVDTGATVPPFYNSLNPSVPLVGQGGLGAQNYTVRQGALVVSTKAGIAAATGSQVTPAPDAGYTGIYVITVANGQTAITSLNFSSVSTAPFIPVTLPGVPVAIQNEGFSYVRGTGTASALFASISPAPAALVEGMRVSVKAPFSNTGATTFNLNGLGTRTVLARDGSPLNANDIANGSIIDLRYNGVAWQLTSDRSSPLPIAVTDNALWHIGSGTTGTTTALSTVLSPVPSAAAAGLCMRVLITASNGNAPTMNFGFGAKPIIINSTGAPPTGAEMPGGEYADFIYDGTSLRLINPDQRQLTLNSVYTFVFANVVAQSLPNGTQRVLQFTDVEPNGYYTNNGASGIVVVKAGIYAISGNITIGVSNSSSGAIIVSASLFKNGTDMVDNNFSYYVGSGNNNVSAALPTSILKLAAGDVLYMTAQDLSASYTGAGVITGANSCYLSITKII